MILYVTCFFFFFFFSFKRYGREGISLTQSKMSWEFELKPRLYKSMSIFTDVGNLTTLGTCCVRLLANGVKSRSIFLLAAGFLPVDSQTRLLFWKILDLLHFYITLCTTSLIKITLIILANSTSQNELCSAGRYVFFLALLPHFS